METTLTLNHKPLRLTLSSAAERALSQREQPLHVEMELYFSCLIRKRVMFGDTPSDDSLVVNDKLAVRFHPVMSQGCSIADNEDGPPLEDFPIVAPKRFSPQWLSIDYQAGQWQGEFGY